MKTAARRVKNVDTWAELIADFREHLGPEAAREHGYMQWMRDSASLTVAIDRAARATYPNGKRHNHQSRVRVLEEWRLRLRARQRWFDRCDTFDQLHDLCHMLRIPGIGPVTVYDTAQRIGEYLGVQPTRVYLHAGVKLGADALGLETKGREHLEMQELPRPLQSLTANEVEDFLCVYHEVLPRFRKERHVPTRPSER